VAEVVAVRVAAGAVQEEGPSRRVWSRPMTIRRRR
jgi:hypothetical protein